MSAVNEAIVREYFEVLGFLVSQPHKYVPSGRRKHLEEEADLVVVNPSVKEQKIPEHMVWNSADLKGVAQAVVGVRGWHTERFSAATFGQTPDILRFAEDDAVRLIEKRIGAGSIAKILCLPRLPASGELRQETIRVLKEKGINGVISFETMLLELVSRIDRNKNYEKSDILQVVRILKSYGLLKDSQMDFFGKRGKRRSSKHKTAMPIEQSGEPA